VKYSENYRRDKVRLREAKIPSREYRHFSWDGKKRERELPE
jgi:hypothetical protein